VIPLRIRTVAGKLIYDSSRADQATQLRFDFLNEDPRLNRPIDTSSNYPSAALAFNAKASDLVALKSNYTLGTSFSPASQQVQLGQEAYLFGFPDPVKGYAGGRVSGKEIAGSHGFAIGAIKQRGTTRFSNYSNVGMSGAPVLSPDGNLLGMSCGSFGLENKVANPAEVNATAITLDKTALEELWRGLSYE
jgi:hypothetical protein